MRYATLIAQILCKLTAIRVFDTVLKIFGMTNLPFGQVIQLYAMFLGLLVFIQRGR